MQHSQSENVLGGSQNKSWNNLKEAEGLKKRANTAQNLQYYVEEQKRLYLELPFMVLPGMRRQSFQRERSFSNLKAKPSWGSFTNLTSQRGGEEQTLLGGETYVEPGYTIPLLLSCCVALMSAFQFGFNTGVTGALDPNLVFPGHTYMQWSICVASFAIGGPIGSIVAGSLSNRFGRKKALLADSILFILSGWIMMFSYNIMILTIGRLLVGFSAGAVSVIVPLYLGELAPPNLRGALGTGYQFGVVIGILAADFLAFAYSSPSNGLSHPGWRLIFGFTILPALLQMICANFLVESPRWLLAKNRPNEAVTILRLLRGTTDVYEEIDSICSASENEKKEKDATFFSIILDKSIRFPLMVAITLQLIQQLSGINAVMFYSNSFFHDIGLQNPLMGTTLVGIINVISTGVALVLMDSAGRRPLLLYSCVGMFFSAIILTGGMLNLFSSSSSLVSVGGMMSYVWFFEIGLGPIPWLIVAEMIPSKSRTTAMSLATMVNWLCSFIIGIGFPILQTTLTKLSFLPFAAILFFAFFFVLKFVPETKGKTLEEIQQDMQKNK